MWSLIVGGVGLVAVVIGAIIVVRRGQRPAANDLRWGKYDTISYCSLTYLCFFIGPGIAAVLGVINDPILDLAPVAIATGVLGLVIVAIGGAVAVQRARNPAERSWLIRRNASYDLLLALFFLLPGVLTHFRILPDPVPGITMGAAIAVYFFLEMWLFKGRERILVAEEATVGPP
jgi:hypothetical protein